MQDQEMVHITMDGKPVVARQGQTVLEAAKDAGIDIPVLCQHPAIQNYGGCRMCVVKTNKTRGLQTSCTLPVVEGMDIITEDEEIFKSRQFILQLIFSERNHYCMFCQMSGDCELQDMAYRYGLDHWIYRRPFRKYPVDASSKYLIYDPNRCILCTRCVRACSEIAANNTLGLKNRGSYSVVAADLDVPLGESTCVECGVCAQVCPTGALVDTHSAYGGREVDVVHNRTTCTQCSVGCSLDVVTRHQRLLRVDGVWDSEPGNGLLCVDGRFKPLYEKRERLTQPLVRRDGQLAPASWDEALKVAAGSIQGAFGLTACDASNDAFQAFARLFPNAGRIGPVAPKLGEKNARFADLLSADLIILAGANPLESHKVVGYLIKQAVDKGAELITVGNKNGLENKSFLNANWDQVDQVIKEAANYGKVVVIYGVDLDPAAARALKALNSSTLFLELDPARNGRGAQAAGLNPVEAPKDSPLYLFLGEQDVPTSLVNGNSFVVVHACYLSPLVEKADVVLPAPLWFERHGRTTNIEGRELELTPVLPMPEGVRDEVEVFESLAGLL
ncbi:MAG: molybdopterin-dependent oxidoreductase [Anaerolineales bacterium]|nr:molybdopterin-dependent oxidoreductase [Anaerolineales bacterium]